MTAHSKPRKAVLADLDTLVLFQIAMAKETEGLDLDPEILRKGIAAIFRNPQLGQYYISLLGQETAGCMLIQNEWSDWRNGYVWWIHSVYFKPEVRGRGLFKELYFYIKSLMADDPNIRGLRLYVDKANISAQSVYTKLGMNGDHYRMFEWMKTF